MTRPIEGEAKVEAKGDPERRAARARKGRLRQGRRFAAPGEYRVDIDVEGEDGT